MADYANFRYVYICRIQEERVSVERFDGGWHIKHGFAYSVLSSFFIHSHFHFYFVIRMQNLACLTCAPCGARIHTRHSCEMIEWLSAVMK